MNEDRKAMWRTALIGSFWGHKDIPGRTYHVLGLSFDRPDLDDPECTGRLTLGHNAGDFTGVHARYSLKRLREEFIQAVSPDVAPNTSVEVVTGEASPEPRKPVQITSAVRRVGGADLLYVHALANDGTIWYYDTSEYAANWTQLPALPQPKGEK